MNDLNDILQTFLETEVELYNLSVVPRKIIDIVPTSWRPLIGMQSSLEEIITQLWNPLLPYTEVPRILASNCYEVKLLHSPNNQIPIRLCYLFKEHFGEKVFNSCWVGNPPASTSGYQYFKNSFSTTFPDSYRLFTRVHNGFTIDGNEGIGFHKTEDLISLTDMLLMDDVILHSGDRNGQNQSLIVFALDTSGDAYCYDLGQPVNGDYLTIGWDHETQSTFSVEPFWEFFDRFIRESMGLGYLK